MFVWCRLAWTGTSKEGGLCRGRFVACCCIVLTGAAYIKMRQAPLMLYRTKVGQCVEFPIDVVCLQFTGSLSVQLPIKGCSPCSFWDMELYRIHVVLLLYLYHSIVNGCSFNDCICEDGLVICELDDDSRPYFSDDELIDTESLHITGTQKEWLNDQCGAFQRLQTVVFRDKTACPSQSCVPCV